MKHKRIQIVSYDWLESSLLEQNRKPEGRYLCSYRSRQSQRMTTANKRESRVLTNRTTSEFLQTIIGFL